MDKEKLIDTAYNRGKTLTLKNKQYLKRVYDYTIRSLKEDIFVNGDVTADTIIKKNKKIKAQIIAKSEGIIAGIEEAVWFYHQNNIKVKVLKKDGQKIKKGDIIIKMIGQEKDLLKTERVGLNLLQHMSSIATSTKKMVEKIKEKAKVAATRKTRWGLLDKRAVYIGEGMSHRLGLFESILIKENHLETIKEEGYKNYIEIAIKRALKNKKAKFIEIEVEDTKEFFEAVKTFEESKMTKKRPCIIMLDNFSATKTTKVINEFKKRFLNSKIIIESSGGITPKNIINYAKSGVDIISMGYLTYASDSIDLSQRIIR